MRIPGLPSVTRFRDDERGAVAVLLVPMLTVLGGMAAVGVDSMHGFATHAKLRTTAEMAATAGVLALSDPAEARRLALLFAERNRPEGTTGTVVSSADVEIGLWDRTARTFSPNQAPSNAIRATASLTQAKGNPLATWFGGLIGRGTIDVAVSAIAAIQPAKPCVVSLDKTGSAALALASNAVIDSPKCEVHSSSLAADGLTVASNAQITASRTCVEGGYEARNNATIEPPAVSPCNAVEDPFAHVPPPDHTGQPCIYQAPIVGRTMTLQPGVYCGGLDIDGNSDITFAPGEYIIKDGPFRSDSNTKLSGTGVGFFLTGAGALLSFSSNTQLSFTAPQSGPLAGFVFYQDRNFGGTHQVNSNVAARLDGVLYFPKATLSSASNATWGASSSCLMVVTHRLQFNSNSGIAMDSDFTRCPWMQDNLKRSRIVG